MVFFLAAVLVQAGYFFYFYSRIVRYSFSPDINIPSEKIPVTVIICARNEAVNLARHLPQILEQRYNRENGQPAYEVVVVDDCSADRTNEVLAELERTYPHLRHIRIHPSETRSWKGKKEALSRGVAAARCEWLLFTDADCRPAGRQWLAAMVKPLYAGKEIVCGYGGYDAGNGWLNAFVRWETMHTFLQYATYTLAGMPYMAVGRNMACTKDVQLRAQAWPAWNAIPSGDDDMLVQACGNRENTAVVGWPGSFTYSRTPEGLAAWIRQKKRHLSTGKFYSSSSRRWLGLYAVTHALFWILSAVLLYLGVIRITIFCMAFRCVMYWLVWLFTAQKLGDRGLWKWFPLFDPAWMCYNFVFSPYIFLKNQQQWK